MVHGFPRFTAFKFPSAIAAQQCILVEPAVLLHTSLLGIVHLLFAGTERNNGGLVPWIPFCPLHMYVGRFLFS